MKGYDKYTCSCGVWYKDNYVKLPASMDDAQVNDASDILTKIFKDKTLMITGGTGSFGNAVLNRFLNSLEFRIWV